MGVESASFLKSAKSIAQRWRLAPFPRICAAETRMSRDPRRTADRSGLIIFSGNLRRSSGCKWLEMDALLITYQLEAAWDN